MQCIRVWFWKSQAACSRSAGSGSIRALAAGAYAGIALLQAAPTGAQQIDARSSQPATAAPKSAVEGTRLLGSALASLVRSIDLAEQKEPDIAEILRELQRELEALEVRLNAGHIEVDADLTRICSQYAGVIQSFTSRIGSGNTIQQVKALTRDVALKNEFASSKSGLLGQPMNLQVEVRIETLVQDSKTQVPGYQIVASPWAFAQNGIWLFNFSSPTNDAVRRLTPGLYQFQASRAGRKPETQAYEVGARGASKEVKTLFVDVGDKP